MEARTPHPLDAWELEHGDRALAEGWGLFEVSHPGHDAIEIERVDDSVAFADDDEAGAFVIISAWLGDPTAKAAIDLLFEQKCYQAIAEAAAAFVQAGYDVRPPYDADELTRRMSAAADMVAGGDAFHGVAARHLPLMPAITINETARVDPATGIVVYTNAEADRAYRLFELNEVPKHEWMVRLILHATDTQPARFADVQLTLRPVGLDALRLTFRETNSDDQPIGPTRSVPLSAIDAIVIY